MATNKNSPAPQFAGKKFVVKMTKSMSPFTKNQDKRAPKQRNKP